MSNTRTESKFVVQGSQVSVQKMNMDLVQSNLHPQVYSVAHNDVQGFYLEMIKDVLEVPKKVYGGADSRVDKCLRTYAGRKNSTGILMTGDKGTGKSLTMAILANKAITELNLPVIMVTQGYAGEQFTKFISDIGECCLVFDEFGKIYGRNRDDNQVSQDALLTLMDGVDKTKRMIIMTENNKHDVNEFMLNRPSRIYYHFEYKKLDESSVTDYCSDKGVSESVTNEILEYLRGSQVFSFDMLQTMVEEHIRFEAPVADLIADLNIEFREDFKNQMRITKVVETESNIERKLAALTSNLSVPGPGRHVEFAVRPREDLVKAVTSKLGCTVASLDEDQLYEHDLYNETIHLGLGHLKYEKGDHMVFDSGEFTIAAERTFLQNYNYSKFTD